MTREPVFSERSSPPEAVRCSRFASHAAITLCCLVASGGLTLSAKRAELALNHQTIPLPGPPVAVIPSNLDGNDLPDLVVIVAYTTWDRVTFDRIEDAMQVIDVVPALFDRREAFAFLGDANGRYVSAGEALELPESVISIIPGTAAHPIIAMTDEGLADVRLLRAADGPALELQPFHSQEPVFAGTDTFFPSLPLIEDVDGDGELDILFPAREGLVVLRSDGERLEQIAALPTPPGDETYGGVRSITRTYALPYVAHVDGDRHPDLVFPLQPLAEGIGIVVLPGTGKGLFDDARQIPLEPFQHAGRLRKGEKDAEKFHAASARFLGDIDGDGDAELVTWAMKKGAEGGLKQFRAAKDPTFLFQFYRQNGDFEFETEPYFELVAHGYAVNFQLTALTSGGFVDLDGDDRLDLVTVSFDFSLMQAVRVLATKRLSIGVDFHVFSQAEDGSLREVRANDLSEKLKFNLSQLELTRFAEFAGDFDGDGIVDFVHVGRGKRMSIHKGQAGGRYPSRPDLVVHLETPIEALALVEVRDLDNDGLADIAITEPLKGGDDIATAPIRLQLYTSRGAR